MSAVPSHAATGGGCAGSDVSSGGVKLYMRPCVSWSNGALYSDTYTDFHKWNAVGGWTNCSITIRVRAENIDVNSSKYIVIKDCLNAANSTISGSRYFTGPTISSFLTGESSNDVYYNISGIRNGIYVYHYSTYSPELYH
jgi:hypothetical protein